MICSIVAAIGMQPSELDPFDWETILQIEEQARAIWRARQGGA